MPNNEIVKAVKNAARAIRFLERHGVSENHIPETLNVNVDTGDMHEIATAIDQLVCAAKVLSYQRLLDESLDTITRIYPTACYDTIDRLYSAAD